MKLPLFLLPAFLLLAHPFPAIADAGAGPGWQDFHIDDQGSLTQELRFTDKRGGSIVLPRGDAYVLDDVMGLDMISVVLFTFRAKTCADPEASSEMELFLVDGMPRDSKAEVGAIYAPECMLEVYVETKDLSTPSFFAR